MPATELIFFKTVKGVIPMREFLAEVRKNRATYAACWAAIQALRDYGRDLNRNNMGTLRDGIFELRVTETKPGIRFLFAYVGQDIVLLTHGITKERKVPEPEIDRALALLAEWEADPEGHSA